MKLAQIALLLLVALGAAAYFSEVPAYRCADSWWSCLRAIAAPDRARSGTVPLPSSRAGGAVKRDGGETANGSIVGYVEGRAAGADRAFVASLEAEVRHDCALDALGVVVEVSETTGNARLGEAVVNRIQAGETTVAISASVGVSEPLAGPAEVRFRIGAEDRCSRRSGRSFFVLIESPPPSSAESEHQRDAAQ
jgi:hypothetical protein